MNRGGAAAATRTIRGSPARAPGTDDMKARILRAAGPGAAAEKMKEAKRPAAKAVAEALVAALEVPLQRLAATLRNLNAPGAKVIARLFQNDDDSDSDSDSGADAPESGSPLADAARSALIYADGGLALVDDVLRATEGAEGALATGSDALDAFLNGAEAAAPEAPKKRRFNPFGSKRPADPAPADPAALDRAARAWMEGPARASLDGDAARAESALRGFVEDGAAWLTSADVDADSMPKELVDALSGVATSLAREAVCEVRTAARSLATGVANATRDIAGDDAANWLGKAAPIFGDLFSASLEEIRSKCATHKVREVAIVAAQVAGCAMRTEPEPGLLLKDVDLALLKRRVFERHATCRAALEADSTPLYEALDGGEAPTPAGERLVDMDAKLDSILMRLRGGPVTAGGAPVAPDYFDGQEEEPIPHHHVVHNSRRPSVYFRCADVSRTGRGAAAAGTRIFRGDASRRRRGRDADLSEETSRSRPARAPGTSTRASSSTATRPPWTRSSGTSPTTSARWRRTSAPSTTPS